MKRPLAPAFSLFVTAFTLACSPTTPPPSTPDNAPAANAATSTAAADQPVPAASEAPGTGAPTPSKAGPTGALCGGIAGFGCAAGLYCAFPLAAHCGAADQSGVCQPIAERCTEQYDPVCGCNDKTYPNECYAAREGISVGAKGACATSAPPPSAGSASTPAGRSEGSSCGSRGLEPCAAGLYCKFGPDCGDGDHPGKCSKIPQICTRIYRPVCGCDGKTHASDCVAASAGVAVRHEGDCKAN